uniref:hypothetical protein n=1 Tax=Pseudomonas sp. UMAB-40 TaxID=1365407 RepID=UPI001C58F82F
AGEVERLRSEIARYEGGALKQVCDHLNGQNDTLRVQLTEANNLLKKMADIDLSATDFDHDHWQYLLGEVSLQLTTSADPTCGTCGVVIRADAMTGTACDCSRKSALPSILDLPYDVAQKIDCELPDVRLPGGRMIAGVRFTAPAPAPKEPVLVEAVAVIRECEEDGLRVEWTLEGGIAALELPGTVLLVAHGAVTNDEGHGYVIPVEGEGNE